jgi:hypothetical protein
MVNSGERNKEYSPLVGILKELFCEMSGIIDDYILSVVR